jgi:hypothetical protein
MNRSIRQPLTELATNAYRGRLNPAPEDEDANLTKSFTDLNTFCGQLIEEGKKVVLSIEFGIRRFERNRFSSLVNLLAQDHFSNYNKDRVHVIFGVDGDFDNYSMLRTMGELLDGGLSRKYKLLQIHREEDFKVRENVQDEEREDPNVVNGTTNVYSFLLEEKQRRDNLIRNNNNLVPNNNTRKQNNQREQKIMNVCVVFLKHTIKSSYFNVDGETCQDFALYHKAQQSRSIKHFSRGSVPMLPFWTNLQALCLGHRFESIYYGNFAHLDTLAVEYNSTLRKAFFLRNLTLNKFSERMSEIWYILFQALASTPIKLFDLDIVRGGEFRLNRTFETQSDRKVIPLTEGLEFHKRDESARMKVSGRDVASFDELMTTRDIPQIDFDPFHYRWDELCPDILQELPAEQNGNGNVQGGRRKRKTHKKRRTRRLKA